MVRRGPFGDMFWRLQSPDGLGLGCEAKGNQGCLRVNQGNWMAGTPSHRHGRDEENRSGRRGNNCVHSLEWKLQIYLLSRFR